MSTECLDTDHRDRGVYLTTPPPPPDAPPPQGSLHYDPPAWVLPKQAYTPWATRVVAFLVDWAPIWLIVFVPLIGLLIAGDMECIDSIYGSGGSYCSTAVRRLLGSPLQFIAFLPGAV